MKKKILSTLLAAAIAAGTFAPAATAEAAGGTWKEDSTGWWYEYSDGSYAQSEWVDGCWISGNGYWQYKPTASWYQDSTGWYYMDTSGYYEKNDTVTIDGVSYSFDGNGYMIENKKGWVSDSNGWWYSFGDGTWAESEWIDGYWLSANGYWTYPNVGSWGHDSAGWWWSDTSGWYAKSESVKIDGIVYDFDDRGYLINYTQISPATDSKATVTFKLSSGTKSQAGKDLSTLLGAITADGASHAITVNGVEKTATNKAGVIYVDDETLEACVARTANTTDVEFKLDTDAKNIFTGIKLAPGGYNYTIEVAGVTFRDIQTTANGVTFMANGGSYKGDVKDGVLYVEGDQSEAAWVKSLKSGKVIEYSTPVVDHK